MGAIELGLEADVVFIIDTDKMEKDDKGILYSERPQNRGSTGMGTDLTNNE
jgi:hypothetical protein